MQIRPRTQAPRLNKALKADMTDSLAVYHKLDGKKNGSPGDSVQLAPGLKDEAALEQQIDKLTSFLASKDDIEFRPPTEGVKRSTYRKKIAKKAAKWVKSSAKPALQAALSGIADPSLRALAQAGLESTADEFFTAPSSSSGRYHPADEISDGGLVLHTCRDIAMADHLGDFYGISPKEKDIVKTALVLHDTWKGGEPWRGYAQDHGDLAAAHIATLPGGNTEDGKTVQRLVANHMAQWNKTADRTPDPRVPADQLEQIVSYADYLASQDSVYQTVPGASGK